VLEVEDRNCWTMAEAAGHPGPHRMQHLLSRARVDEQQMLDAAAGWGRGIFPQARSRMPVTWSSRAMQSQTDVADSDVQAAREPPFCAATLVVEGRR
jgi:hypothetical protein